MKKLFFILAALLLVGVNSVYGETVKYTFSSYTAGTQYAIDEVHALDDILTVTTTKCHFTTQLRIYSSDSNDGYAVFSSTKDIESIVINAGYKKDNLNVYTSTDGSSWTLAKTVSVTSTGYNDYTVTFASATKYIKLDVAGTNQVRIQYITVTYALSVDEVVNATAIELDQATLSLEQYREATLTATLTPAEATTEVTWSSDNEEVATVANGVVTAVGAGTANIKATAGEGVEATCAVTVSEATPITCAQAAEYAATVSGNNVPYEGGQYVIHGYVTEIVYEYSETHGMTFWMDDVVGAATTFEAYQVVPTDLTNLPVVGDQVEVIGYITKHNTTYETAKGASVRVIKESVIPALSAEVEAIDFGSIEKGSEFDSQALHITGENLAAAPEAIVVGKNSVFAVEVANASVEGCDLTVTCSATTPGVYTDELYISAGTVELSISLKATVLETYTITWSVNGVESTMIATAGEKPVYNDGTDPETTNSKVFMGWGEAAIEGSTDEAPALLASNEIPAASADVTYYAVFATKTTVEEGEAGWNKADINDIAATDVVVITCTKQNTYWAISNNNGTSKAPTAAVVTVSENKITAGVSDAIKWNISNENGNLTIYPNGTTDTWLYCTDGNNGVRVGDNTNKEFTIDATTGYLKHTATSRYVGVYIANPDFRCYDNTTGNTAGQTLVFFKYENGTTTTYSAYVTTIPTSENPTALENAAANEVKAVKVIENGQLVIVKDGVRYNVLGTVIK